LVNDKFGGRKKAARAMPALGMALCHRNPVVCTDKSISSIRIFVLEMKMWGIFARNEKV
jgi:hypothetical protein